MNHSRNIGLMGATAIGVGAIVGGGILALAGVAFQTTGPSAVLAFALNGVIALLTALSFAEMAAKFPESGGTYTFSRKVLSIESAFTVGWVVWFASILAAVLYALGFAHFGVLIGQQLLTSMGIDTALPSWSKTALALLLTVALSVKLTRSSGGSGMWENIGKVAVFGVLIAGGLWILIGQPTAQTADNLRPFFANGGLGLVTAMGYTFIALQGFDLIVAAGGEVANPEKNLPRAMVLSLIIALMVYLPLLLIIATVGPGPGQTIQGMAHDNPEELIAVASRGFLGPFGYWLVMVAALLSMFTALSANLFAASRIAMTMARDRTLPIALSRLHRHKKTPHVAITVTGIVVSLLILVLPDISVAGASSSLIFLITFAIAHWLSILVRQRSAVALPFQAPLFPCVPIIGGVTCLGLAVFQAVAVPTAGLVSIGWLSVGGILFLALFARRARFVDASSKGTDPELLTMRGRSPLVLVPIANPDNAEPLLEVADSIVPLGIGRVLVHNVVVAGSEWQPDEEDHLVERSQKLLSQLLRASARVGIRTETLTTVADKPMHEIARVARLHACDTVLVGLSHLSEQNDGSKLEWLLGVVQSDVVVLHAPAKWQLSSVRRILVPVAGQGGHDYLLARFLGSLLRAQAQEVRFLRILTSTATEDETRKARITLDRIAMDTGIDHCNSVVIRSDDVVETIVQQSQECDLLILGAQRVTRSRRLFGRLTRQITEQTDRAVVIMSSQR